MTTLRDVCASAAPKTPYHDVILTARVTGYLRALKAVSGLAKKHNVGFAFFIDLAKLANADERTVSPEEFPDA